MDQRMRTYLTLSSAEPTQRNHIEYSLQSPYLILACRDVVALDRQVSTEESTKYILEGTYEEREYKS